MSGLGSRSDLTTRLHSHQVAYMSEAPRPHQSCFQPKSFRWLLFQSSGVRKVSVEQGSLHPRPRGNCIS